MKKTALRMLALALLICLLVCSGMSVLAETVMASQAAKIYLTPNAAAPSMTIPAGTVMLKSAEQGGWIRVHRAGMTAYMPAGSVTAVTSMGGAVAYTAVAAPMYKAYGSAAQYGTLPAGTALNVYAVAGNWACVGYAGCKGFVAKDALTTQKPAVQGGNASAGDSNVVITKGMYAYTAVEGAPVYRSYTDAASLMGNLPVNTVVAVGAVSGSWAFVGMNGHYGFMLVSHLSKTKIDETQVPETNASEDIADTGSHVSTTVPESANDGVSSAVPARGRAIAMDWWSSDIQNIFAKGTTATITDVATGIAWKEIRKGGTNHADVQPVTAADTAAMKAAVGSWSWNRRAIFVTINGVNYAASMNCMPHGSGSIKNNNFDGHHCIHFTNSRGHSSNKVCSLHQAAIQKALAAVL